MGARQKEREAKVRTGLSGKTGTRRAKVESMGNMESFLEKRKVVERKKVEGMEKTSDGMDFFKRSQKTERSPVRGRQDIHGEEGQEEERMRNVAIDIMAETLWRESKVRMREQWREVKEKMKVIRREVKE